MTEADGVVTLIPDRNKTAGWRVAVKWHHLAPSNTKAPKIINKKTTIYSIVLCRRNKKTREREKGVY